MRKEADRESAMKKTGRGVVYVIWGNDPKYERALERSRRSLAGLHPDIPVEVIRPRTTDPIEGLREKAHVFSLTPFAETLLLDVDTVVFDRLDFGFEKASRFGLACSICECPWARRYTKSIKGDVVEYNTGVLFFTERCAPLFAAWERLANELDASMLVLEDGKLRGEMPFNDQCAFAAAVESTAINPFVLPLNWNFRPAWQKSFFGPIRIWHAFDEPPAIYAQMAQYYRSDQAIIQYAALS
jgi:hypothetical protein